MWQRALLHAEQMSKLNGHISKKQTVQHSSRQHCDISVECPYLVGISEDTEKSARSKVYGSEVQVAN